MEILPPIEHSVFIAATPERVYETLTTGAGWDAWFTQGADVSDERISFRWKDWGPDKVSTEDEGPILVRQPAKRFTFRWSPGDTPTTVDFVLEAREEGTVLRLTESGYASSVKDTATCIGCATGWGEALTLLKFYLEHGVTYGPVP